MSRDSSLGTGCRRPAEHVVDAEHGVPLGARFGADAFRVSSLVDQYGDAGREVKTTGAVLEVAADVAAEMALGAADYGPAEHACRDTRRPVGGRVARDSDRVASDE